MESSVCANFCQRIGGICREPGGKFNYSIEIAIVEKHEMWMMGKMSEIVDFLNHGAALITPKVAKDLLPQIPFLKAEFATINEPRFPHLVNQLEFLADAVEDFMEGAYHLLPYYAFCQAVFALTYAHKKTDIIPDFVNSLGRADDSSIVRAVLIQNRRHFQRYAESQNFKWEEITSDP